jgi:hypothetical protein
LKNKLNKKEYASFATSVTTQVALAGVKSLPFAPSVMALLDALNEGHEKKTGVNFKDKIEAAVPKKLQDYYRYGVLGTETPINMSGSLASSNVFEGADQGSFVKDAILGAYGAPIDAAFTSIAAYNKGSPVNKIVEANLPGALKNLKQAYDAKDTGVITDYLGKSVNQNAPLTTAELLAKAIGFSPKVLDETRSEARDMQRIVEMSKDKGNIYDRAVQAGFRSPEEFQSVIDENNARNEQVPEFMQREIKPDYLADKAKEFKIPKIMAIAEGAPKQAKGKLAEIYNSNKYSSLREREKASRKSLSQ